MNVHNPLKAIPLQHAGETACFDFPPFLKNFNNNIPVNLQIVPKKASPVTSGSRQFAAYSSTDVTWHWDVSANRLYYSNGIVKMFGHEVFEIRNIDAWWKQQLHVDDFAKFYNTFNEVFRNKRSDCQLTYRFKNSDDTYKYIHDRWFIIFDSHGRPEKVIGVMHDLGNRDVEDVRMAKIVLATQEKERQQIGSELHDNVNQILTGCLLNLAMMKNASPAKAAELAETSREYILTAVYELRKLSHRLVPVSHEDITLEELFKNLVLSMNIHKQFKITTRFEQLRNTMIPEEIRLNLYRMLQEQLTNIVKYSGATAIEISVKASNNIIKMRVYDNGNGFNAGNTHTGIGLNNIRKRIQLLNGTFSLTTAEGKGCELIAEIPVAGEAA